MALIILWFSCLVPDQFELQIHGREQVRPSGGQSLKHIFELHRKEFLASFVVISPMQPFQAFAYITFNQRLKLGWSSCSWLPFLGLGGVSAVIYISCHFFC
jgi:hypothetical protein